MKKNTLLTIGLLGAAYWLFISYRKKTTPAGYVFVGQSNAPTGTQQVYSNVGTKIYDQNNNLIYTYDTANLGMTVTGTNGNKLTGSVFVGQSNAPTGTRQVYSNVGTKIYDKNNNLIYTYDTANLGMTVLGSTGSKLNVVIGSDFANGQSGFVDSSEIQTI